MTESLFEVPKMIAFNSGRHYSECGQIILVQPIQTFRVGDRDLYACVLVDDTRSLNYAILIEGPLDHPAILSRIMAAYDRADHGSEAEKLIGNELYARTCYDLRQKADEIRHTLEED